MSRIGSKKVGSGRAETLSRKEPLRSGDHNEAQRNAPEPGALAEASKKNSSPFLLTDNAIRIPIATDLDIIKARQEGRKAAEKVGFQLTDLALIATAISELTRNIVRYARQGELTIRPVNGPFHQGIEIIARDEGPGIKDTEQALEVGYSTSGGLGLGLPGVRRLMDEFAIQSRPGSGTTVIATKWKD